MQDYRIPPSHLRVQFPRPGFFLADTTLTLAVNGYPVWMGSFRDGFDWWKATPPGQYHVALAIAAPLGITRSKVYAVEVRDGLTTIVVVQYSRMWGNFTGAPMSVQFVRA